MDVERDETDPEANTPPLPERLFWHRVGAFWIDYAIMRVSVAVIFLSLGLLGFVPAEIPQIIVEAVVWFLLILMATTFLTLHAPTPGKRMMGLRISGEGCAICREMRRLWPGLVAAFVGLALLLPGLSETTGVSAVAQLGVLLVIVIGLRTHLEPVLRWTGAMPYDRATGFWVERDG